MRAFLWRACLLGLLLGVLTAAAARPGAFGHGVPEVQALDEEEAIARIEAFRKQQLDGDYALDFTLKEMPSRGEECFYHGTLWGRWEKGLPFFYLEVQPPQNTEGLVLLIHSGPRPEAWEAKPGQVLESVNEERLYEPLLPQLHYTPFDLSMAFVYWESQYIASKRVRGQPVHVFDMFPPKRLPTDISKVRISLHVTYDILVEAVLYNRNNEAVKKLSILSFKEVQGQWIVKEIDYRNLITHDKSRFTVRRAALGEDLPEAFFSPSWDKERMPPAAYHWSLVE